MAARGWWMEEMMMRPCSASRFMHSITTSAALLSKPAAPLHRYVSGSTALAPLRPTLSNIVLDSIALRLATAVPKPTYPNSNSS